MAENGVPQQTDPSGKAPALNDGSPQDRGKDMKPVLVDGDYFPPFPVKSSVEDHLHNLKNMPMREDDVIIAAFPKCGTHWVWEVTQMLVKGKPEYDTRPKETFMLEFNEVDKMADVPSPRVLNSHLFLRHLSKEIVTKRPRVIHVIRNPKDVAVSLYYHVKQIRWFEDIGVKAFIEKFPDGALDKVCFMNYCAYMPEMFKWQRENPDVPVINIYFEDMKKDPVQCVRQLAQFLKVEASQQLCEAIADRCSFSKLKQADQTLKDDVHGKDAFKDGDPKLYRKGEVGDWKNYFTVALSERYDREIPDKLKACDLKFQYTI